MEEINEEVVITRAEAALFRALLDEKMFPGAAADAVSRLREKLPVSEVQISGDKFVVPVVPEGK